MKKYNFNAGPSMLPREVIEATADACLDFEGSGLSLMEISHRAKNFQPVVDKAVELVKELLDLPAGYSVVFLAGGASTEFCRVPYNFLEKKAAYLNTGTWAKKAMKWLKLLLQPKTTIPIFRKTLRYRLMQIICILRQTIRFSERKCVMIWTVLFL